MRPLLINDWRDALFIHYAVDLAELQPHVPFPLDLRQDRAYVSLVLFSLRRIRPAFVGPFGSRLTLSCLDHRFLNLRTYVRGGIYFISEWLDSRAAVWVGPRTFGLPYRYARHSLRLDPAQGTLSEEVIADRRFACRATFDPVFEISRPGSLDAFLLERYAAFTRGKRFRVEHAPWPQAPARVTIEDDGLVSGEYDWFRRARLLGANYSPGVRNVAIGRSQWLTRA